MTVFNGLSPGNLQNALTGALWPIRLELFALYKIRQQNRIDRSLQGDRLYVVAIFLSVANETNLGLALSQETFNRSIS